MGLTTQALVLHYVRFAGNATNLPISCHPRFGYFITDTALLFSYFVCHIRHFEVFVEEMRPLFGQLDLTVALKCIMEHSGKAVLLLVDEIMQSGGEAEDPRLIHGQV